MHVMTCGGPHVKAARAAPEDPGRPASQRSSRMVALAWPPPSHMVCNP
jgi:hypothetical protein